MPIPVGNAEILEARFVASFGAQVSINVRHYLTANLAGNVTLLQCAEQISNVFHSDYKALMAAGASYRGIGVRRLTPNPTIEEAFIGDADIGTVAGDPLPKQIAGVITLRTTTPGQAGRGRVYLPFPGGDDNSVTGTPTAGYIGSLQTIRTDFIAMIAVAPSAGNSIDLFPRLLKRSNLTVKEIIAGTARTIWGTQRRRGDYGRPNLLPF